MSDSLFFSALLHFLKFSKLILVTNPQSISGQNISWTHCEFCLHSGNQNWAALHNTNTDCINHDLYSLYWGGTFQPGNPVNWQWLPRWVQWCTQVSVPREQSLPWQGSSTGTSRKLTERAKGYSICKGFHYVHLPSPDKKSQVHSWWTFLFIRGWQNDTWLKFMAATEDTCIQRLIVNWQSTWVRRASPCLLDSPQLTCGIISWCSQPFFPLSLQDLRKNSWGKKKQHECCKKGDSSQDCRVTERITSEGYC